MSLVLNVEILGEFKNLTKATQGSQNELNNLNKKITGFSNSAKKAFAAIGVGLSFAFIARELEEATKAAVEDRKSQELLANQLENTTGATRAQISEVEKQISKLQLTAAVADDELRPAYAQLVRTTGNTTEAMKLLNLATDVSAGSGKSLETITNALSKAYQGKTAALIKLGIPMSDSIQNASDYAKEMAKLNSIQREVAGTTGKDHVEALEKLEKQQDKVNAIVADGIDWQSDLAEAFKGSAEKAANIDPYQRMQIVFGEIQEQIGVELLPILDQFSTWLATPEGEAKLQAIVDFAKQILADFVALVDWVIANKDWLVPVVIAIGTVKVAWEAVTIATNLAKAAQVTFAATAVAQAAIAQAAWAGVAAAAAAAVGATAAVVVGSAAGGYLTTQAGQTERDAWQSIITPNAPKVAPKTTTTTKPSTNVTVNVKTVTDAKTALQKITGLSSTTGVPKSLLLK